MNDATDGSTPGDRRSVRPARRALFTAADDGDTPDRAGGDTATGEGSGTGTDHGGPTVKVECSWCGTTTRRPLLDVAGQAVRPFAWWVPFKRHSRWLTCMACGSRAWCRVDWLAAVRDR